MNLINNSYKNIIVWTTNADALALLISYIGKVELNDIEIHAYLIILDRYYNIKQIIQELGSDIFLALPFFQAFTGCDTVSSFYGKGMCKAHDVRVKGQRRDGFTGVFVELGEKPTNVTSNHIDILESFVLQLYGLRHDTFGAAQLDKLKKFSDNDLCLLPLSEDALRQHIYHSSYQAGYLWGQSVEELDIPDPEQWGWKTDSKGDFQPLRTSSQSSILVKNFIETCSCKTGNCKSCECVHANVICLSMCECGRGYI